VISQLKTSLEAKPSSSIRMRLTPARWWSHAAWNVFEGDLQITSINLVMWFQSRASFEFDLRLYEIIHEWRTADYALRREGEELCRARKRLLRRSFVLRYQDTVFTFQPRSPFDRTFVLSLGEDDDGWVSPRGLFLSQLESRLPKRLPFEARLFLMWLALSTVASG
jgi:hypothetical protein